MSQIFAHRNQELNILNISTKIDQRKPIIYLESKFYGFDTFVGLPEDWTYRMKKDAFNLNGICQH
jgi:hypothetical protein